MGAVNKVLDFIADVFYMIANLKFIQWVQIWLMITSMIQVRTGAYDRATYLIVLFIALELVRR